MTDHVNKPSDILPDEVRDVSRDVDGAYARPSVDMPVFDNKGWALASLSLFTSTGTLVCCALPALLVTIGAGAALAGLVSAVPQLIWLSQYKGAVFAVAGLMLILTGVLRYLNRHAPCPIDPDQARSCMRLRKISSVIFVISCLVYLVGFFFAFLAIHLL